MTRKSPVKRVPKEEVAILHCCTQAENIKRTNQILLGNGHPEDGLGFIVRQSVNHIKEIKQDLADIKLKLSLVTEVNNELEIQSRVNLEVEKARNKFKEEYNNEEGKTHVKKSLFWQTVGVIIALTSVIVMATFSILNFSINKKTKTDTSIIKNDMEYTRGAARGEKFIPDVFKKDTIK